MDRKETDRLLRKFYRGETSLEEEMKLREWFLEQEDLPDEMSADRALFTMYAETERENLPEEDLEHMLEGLDENPERPVIRLFTRQKFYRFAGIAASLVILVSVYLGYRYYNNSENNRAMTETFRDNPELAYAETQRVLLYVSSQFNRGTGELSNLKKLNEPVGQLQKLNVLDKGLDNLKFLNKLNEDQTTNPKKNQ
jgi:hypothetical protein